MRSSRTAATLALSLFSTLLATLSSPIHTILFTPFLCDCSFFGPLPAAWTRRRFAFSGSQQGALGSVFQCTSRHPKQRASSKLNKRMNFVDLPAAQRQGGRSCLPESEGGLVSVQSSRDRDEAMQKASKRSFQSQMTPRSFPTSRPS